MNIVINGQKKEFPESIDLKTLVGQFCKDTQHIIAEVNGAIVKQPQWANRVITHGDVIELVNFVGGG